MREIRLTLLFGCIACKPSRTPVFWNALCYHGFMKADLRISVKDYSRNKSLKVLLMRVPFASRRFFVRMNGRPWPKDGSPASLTRVFTALRKALVKAA